MAVGKKEETAAEGTLRIRLDLRCKTNTGETVFSTRFSPAGDMLAAALGDGSIHLFNVEEGKSQRVLHTKMQNREERPCTAVRWRPNKADTPVILAACSNGSVQLFDLGSGQRTCVWETDNEVSALDPPLYVAGCVTQGSRGPNPTSPMPSIFICKGDCPRLRKPATHVVEPGVTLGMER